MTFGDESQRRCVGVSFWLRKAVVKLDLVKHMLRHEEEEEKEEEVPARHLKFKMQSENSCSQRLMMSRLEENNAKVLAKRNEIAAILSDTLREINERGSFSLLRNYVNAEKQRCRREEAVFAKEESVRECVASLKRDLVELRENAEEERRSKDESIIRLKIHLQRLKRDFREAESALIDESSRQLSALGTMHLDKEKRLQHRLEELQSWIEEERLSHRTVLSHLQHWEHELEMKASHWNLKLEKDVRDLEDKMVRAKTKLASIRLREEELHEMCAAFDKVILEDRRQKDMKQQQEMEKLEEMSAVKIQRWWRQILSLRVINTGKKRHKKSKKPR